jgi:ribonucleoside-diphosphate reductase alpha chain
MIKNGFQWEVDAYDPNNVVCFKFPIKSSSSAIFKNEVSAIEHLELWLKYQKYYCEHKPSATISIKENEWLEVGAWVYKNFDWLSGVAFLPADEGSTVYKQMPFTECSEKEYNELLEKMPKEVNWGNLVEFEKEDSTVNQQTLACTSAEGCFI